MLEDTLLRTLLLIIALNSTVLVLCMFAVLIYIRHIFNGIIIIGSKVISDELYDEYIDSKD